MENNTMDYYPDDTKTSAKAESVPVPGAQEPDERGVYVHKFSEPVEYEGKTYETMTFAFNKLKGRDLISVETEQLADGKMVLAQEISLDSQCKIAAKAAGIGYDLLENLPVPEFSRITQKARSFLLGMA
jgi:hypothetical protein